MFSLPKAKKQFYAFLFSDQHLTIVKLSKSAQKLEFFFETDLPPNIISQSEVVNPKALGELLLKIKNQIRMKSQYAVVGISDHKAISHTFLLPQLEVEEIEGAIKNEAANFLPFPYKDEYLDWMIIESFPNGDKKILILAVPKAIVDSYKEAFKLAKLSPIAFETWSLSLFRQVPKNDLGLSFLLETGRESSLLILIREGSIEAASVVKESTAVFEALDKMKKFYLQPLDGKDKPINIYLSGKGVSDELAKQMKTAFSLNPLTLKVEIAKLPQGRETELALAVSLAKKTIRRPEDEQTINILPDDLSLEYGKEDKAKKEKKLTFILTTLFLLTAFSLSASYFSLKRQKLLLEKALPEKQVEEASETASFDPDLISLLLQADEKGRQLEKMLSFVTETASASVKLTGVKYDLGKKQLSLAGLSGSRENLILFRDNLAKNQLFKKVSVPLSSLETAYSNNFRMTVDF